MAKLPNYNGSIDLISGLRPKNNGTFPLMEAHDVLVADDGTRLDAKLTEIISLVGDSGTLTTDQNSALVAKYPQVIVKLNDVYTLLPVAKVDNMYYFQLVEIGEDEEGKYAGTIYVNINSTTRAWEFGEQYNDIPTGNGLPEVTTADAGEVLTVSNQGEWQAQPLPVYDGATEGGTTGGGSGGSGGGLSVKQITFTDRPSLASWMSENWDKCILASVSADTMGSFTTNVFTSVTFSRTSTYESNSQGISGMYYDSVYVNFGQNPTLISNSCRIIVAQDGSVSGQYGQPTNLPDEYWNAMGVRVTITYIE